MSPRSVGVEEEFLLVEPGTGKPQAMAGTVLREAGPELEAELQEQQVETPPRRAWRCSTGADRGWLPCWH